MLTSKNALIEQVKNLKAELEEPALFTKRWGYMSGCQDFLRGFSLGTWKIGQVIPKTTKIDYNLTKFQTMKNYIQIGTMGFDCWENPCFSRMCGFCSTSVWNV